MGRAGLIFARPWRAPREWLKEQYRLARLPDFLRVQLATVRAQVGLRGQRKVLLDRRSELRRMPALVLWGARVLSTSQAYEAIDGLENGFLEILPDRGHLPQVEQHDQFASALDRFLKDVT